MVKIIKNIILMICIATMFVACSGFGGGGKRDTIGSLNKNRVKVNEDVPVVSSRGKAIKQYRELVEENPEDVHPEVLRRLGDLQMEETEDHLAENIQVPCLLYTSPSPRDATLSRMPSSA